MELVLKIHIKDQNSLGNIRCFPNLQAAKEGDWIWLRGLVASEKLNNKIQQLPARASFRLDEKKRLFPLQQSTPIGLLPDLNWQMLLEFFKVEMPIAALPAEVKKTLRIRLKTAKTEQKTTALLTDISTWKNYAHSASKIRLEALKFVASDQGRVLIWGNPLPAIPGQSLWLKNHIFLPNGWDFDPPVLSALLAKKMDVEDKSVLIFDKNGEWQRVDLDDFVVANRSAIRSLG